jgi:hypothetical protein
MVFAALLGAAPALVWCGKTVLCCLAELFWLDGCPCPGFSRRVVPAGWTIGGCSSVGRAPALQAGGRRFDPVHLHHYSGLDRGLGGLVLVLVLPLGIGFWFRPALWAG